MHLRQFGVGLVLLDGITVRILSGANDRIIVQARVLKERIHRVQPEAGYAALVPPAAHLEHRVLDRRIAPVQVWLFGIKKMIVILVCAGIERPGGPPKCRSPVIWW